MTMRVRLPSAILPRVIAELGRISQLLLGDIGSKTTKRRIICQSTPRDGIMAVPQPDEAAKAHDGISYATRHLVDDEVINLTDILSVCPIDLGPLNVFA